jgi:hypothetical protein
LAHVKKINATDVYVIYKWAKLLARWSYLKAGEGETGVDVIEFRAE